MRRTGATFWVCAVLLFSAGCEKEKRELKSPPSASVRVNSVSLSELHPGPRLPVVSMPNPYEGNAYGISEGQRLYNWYNCAGCHFRGGGGIGPAFMDDFWIYGGSPAQIYRSIVEGRPNGMPAWGGRLPNYQVWQIVAYVQSLKAEKMIASPPGPRSDHLQATEGKQSR